MMESDPRSCRHWMKRLAWAFPACHQAQQLLQQKLGHLSLRLQATSRRPCSAAPCQARTSTLGVGFLYESLWLA